MQGKTHIYAGLLLTIFFSSPIEWLLVLLGVLLPDIDSSKSILGRHTPLIGRAFEHRSFFHSVFLLIPLTIIVWDVLTLQAALAFFCGWCSHLLLDSMTPQGIRLYPFKTKFKGSIRSGGLVDKGLGVLFILAFIIVLIFRNRFFFM